MKTKIPAFGVEPCLFGGRYNLLAQVPIQSATRDNYKKIDRNNVEIGCTIQYNAKPLFKHDKYLSFAACGVVCE